MAAVEARLAFRAVELGSALRAFIQKRFFGVFEDRFSWPNPLVRMREKLLEAAIKRKPTETFGTENKAKGAVRQC